MNSPEVRDKCKNRNKMRGGHEKFKNVQCHI